MASVRKRTGGSSTTPRKSATSPGSSVVSKSKKSSSKEQLGLRSLVQHRFLNDVFQSCTDKFDGWMVLVVDKKSMRALSSAVGMYDIMERKVTLVEDIELKRAPFKDMGVIYLLAPTEDSVDRLIADFESPLYGDAVFVFFLGRLPEKLLEKIKQCRPLLKRLKALSEANVDFLAKELRAFHFDMHRAFNDVYVRRGRSKIEFRMAEKLISICSTLNEYPHIRYANESPTAQALAKTLDVKLNQFLKNDEFWFHGDTNHPGRERATLIILDRKDDCLTPLMHDFTYQSMVHDLLDVKDDIITLDQDNPQAEDDYYDDDYDSDGGDESDRRGPEPSKKSKNAKDILLNENDDVWVELRGKHIAEAINILSDRCREMVNSDTSGFANKNKGQTMSLTQMANALKALPEYREVMAKLSEHMQIAHKCMDKFNNAGLMAVSELEQTLATGQTDEGAKPKLEDVMSQVVKQLKALKDARSRFRLLLITIVSQRGIKPEFKKDLWAAAQVSADQEKLLEAIQDSLDIPLVNSGSEGKLRALFGSRVQGTGHIDTESEFANSRYVPPLKSVLEGIINNTLDVEAYPAVRDLPQGHGTGAGTATSARKRIEGTARKGGATSRWQKSNAREGTKDESYQGGRVIVFVIGGLAYSELRIARDVMAKESREVVVGSTTFSNPNEFLDDLRRLVKSSVPAKSSTRESGRSSLRDSERSSSIRGSGRTERKDTSRR